MMPPMLQTAPDSQLYNIDQININKSQLQKNTIRLLILAVLFLLTIQLLPLARSVIIGYSIQAKQESGNLQLLPVTQAFFKSIFSISYTDPGENYFTELTSKAQELNPKQVTINTSYSKLMYISIPSLKIQDIPLTPNVPSSPKSVYEKALQKGVAHLKHTPLPGDGGNSIIYGHSGLTSLLKRNYPGIVFTKLEKINIGDTVLIKRDGKTLKYKVVAKKIVPPEDLKTIVEPSSNEKITLVTCWPVGIGSQRLIVIAYKQ